MDSSNIPSATLSPEFSLDVPSKLIGYSVAVDGQTVARVAIEEVALAGLELGVDVQTFAVAYHVKAGSILFWHRLDEKLHDTPNEDGVAIGVTVKDLDAGSVVRLHADDGLILTKRAFTGFETAL